MWYFRVKRYIKRLSHLIKTTRFRVRHRRGVLRRIRWETPLDVNTSVESVIRARPGNPYQDPVLKTSWLKE